MNTSLPIWQYRHLIGDIVRRSKVTIITSDTGTGKSTQVPQFLFPMGRALITQPRKLAARTIGQRVADEMGVTLGTKIGIHTSEDRLYGPGTTMLFCTDGIAVVREMLGLYPADFLVIDEVHEWNLRMEVLVAWVRHQLDQKVPYRLVLMSAALESVELSAFFDDAPVIHIPGREFPIEERRAGDDPCGDAIALLREGRNVLFFLPGKYEIQIAMDIICSAPGLRAEVLPLHGMLTPEEQERCFQIYEVPKCILSTNIAETSVTIDDIDAVVDSGFMRVNRINNGVHRLYCEPVSMSSRTQRKGRAGRSKPGIYIDHTPVKLRPEFPTPEMDRESLEILALQCLTAGIEPEDLRFFHPPKAEKLLEARRVLRTTGCLTKEGALSELGQRVATLSIPPAFARIPIETETPGAVEDGLTIAALLYEKEIIDQPFGSWREFCVLESQSDLLAHLAVFRIADGMTAEEMRAHGVNPQNYGYVQRLRKRLSRILGVSPEALDSETRREELLRAIKICLADQLFHREDGRYVGTDGARRSLSNASMIGEPEWVVAIPYDFEVQDAREVVHIVRLATVVHPEELMLLRSDLVGRLSGLNPRFDPERNAVITTTRTLFNGRCIGEEVEADAYHPDAPDLFRNWLADAMLSETPVLASQLNASGANILAANRAMLASMGSLKGRNDAAKGIRERLISWLDARLMQAISFDTIPRIDALLLTPSSLS